MPPESPLFLKPPINFLSVPAIPRRTPPLARSTSFDESAPVIAFLSPSPIAFSASPTPRAREANNGPRFLRPAQRADIIDLKPSSKFPNGSKNRLNESTKELSPLVASPFPRLAIAPAISANSIMSLFLNAVNVSPIVDPVNRWNI